MNRCTDDSPVIATSTCFLATHQRGRVETLVFEAGVVAARETISSSLA